VSPPASLTFLAHHEFRLAWRDWWSMLTAGRPHRIRIVALALSAFALFMHLIAFSIVAKFAEVEPGADRSTLVVITGCAVLAWSLMMSQAMESVTRAFYARADLDLILSSPVASRRVFAVRIATMAASTVLMAGAAGGALHQHPGLARRAPLVQRLWRGNRRSAPWPRRWRSR
jgi:ABC-2 type transport system permease protein